MALSRLPGLLQRRALKRMWQRGPDGDLRRRPPHPPTAEGESGGADSASLRALHARPLRALQRAARDTYEHLWTVVGASCLWMGLALTFLLGAVRLAGLAPGNFTLPLIAATFAIPACLVLGPLTSGLFRFARNASATAEPELLDCLWGFRSMLGRSAGLAAIQLLVTAVLAADSFFFLTR